MHISHLADITDEQINELLGAIVDVENLFMSMQREDDLDTKKVYYYLFRVSNHLWLLVLVRSCFKCEFLAPPPMYSFPTTSSDSWPAGWSAIRKPFDLQGSHELCLLQVSPFILLSLNSNYSVFLCLKVPPPQSDRIPDHDWGRQDFPTLPQPLESRSTQRSISGNDPRRCIHIQDQFHTMARLLPCACLLQYAASLWDDSRVWTNTFEVRLSGKGILLGIRGRVFKSRSGCLVWGSAPWV